MRRGANPLGDRIGVVLAVTGLVAAAVLAPAWWGSAAAAADPTFLVLSPAEDLAEAPGDALIAVSILDPDHVIDGASIRFGIDGTDLTSAASVSPDLVSYVPVVPLAPGRHRIEIRMRAVGGAELPGFRREFRTEGQAMKAPGESFFERRGRLTLELLGDDLSGQGASLRQEPGHTSTGRLDMNGHVSDWKYDLGLFLTSDEERRFQPRNRYALHVDHGWVGVDAGDINYRFSEFTLQGKRARGVGGYLRRGNTELRLIRGSLNRYVEGEITRDSTGAVTSVTGATFERNLIGGRFQVGQGRTFQSGLDVTRVRDDVTSVLGLNPKDNLVIGSNLLWAPFSRRVIFQGDAAVSALTDDISGGAMTTEEIDSLVTGAEVPSWFHPQDWENVYIVNLSTVPLNPKSLSNVAWRGSARGNLYGNTFEARFQSVGPSFHSLAAPSIQSDRAGFRFTDTARLIARKLELGGELETFSDNLKNDKEFTTDTGIFGLNTMFIPGRVDVKNVTAGYRRYHRQNDAPALADSTGNPSGSRIDETTNTFRVGTGYHFFWQQGHELTANYLYSKTDAYLPQGDAKQTDWMLNYDTKFQPVPLGANLEFGVNRTQYPGAVRTDSTGARIPAPSEVKYTTFGVGATWDFLDRRLESYGAVVRVGGDATGGLISANKLTWNAGARYRLNPRTSLAGRVSLVRFSDNTPAAMDYNENVIDLRLVQDF